MRLFIALNFSDSEKQELFKNVEIVKKASVSGSFTLKENLHLTIVFIGETDDVGSVVKVMDAVHASAFDVSTTSFGRFCRDEGDIVWLGLKYPEALNEIYHVIKDGLATEGVVLKDRNRRFKAHLTMGRKVRGFDTAAKSFRTSMHVDGISLMRSDRINGKLTYTEIYKKRLTSQ